VTDKNNTKYNTLISEQPYIHARWSIFTFPGHNEPRPRHVTPWVNSGMIPAIPGRLATLGNFTLCKSFSAYYKILSLTYKVLTTAQPGYLRNLISVDSPYIETRSSSSVTLSQPPSSCLKITNRSFRYASPCFWNKLPATFRNMRPLSISEAPDRGVRGVLPLALAPGLDILISLAVSTKINNSLALSTCENSMFQNW